MMKCWNLKSLSWMLLLGLLLFGYAPQAHAVATLRFIVDGGAPVDCADGAACDSNSTAGVVTVNTGLGAFLVNVTDWLIAKHRLAGGEAVKAWADSPLAVH